MSNRAEPLTREAIVDAALAVSERQGFDRLTMRAVATELGVSPMAIYYHLRDKDELVQLLVAEVNARRVPLVLGDEGWEASLRRYLLSLWEEQRRYPGLGAHLISQPMMGATPDLIDEQVRFFESAGFPPATARLAWSFALTYIHGRLSVDSRLRGRARRQARTGGLSARDHVAFGVDAVVAGIRSMLDGATVSRSGAPLPAS